MEPFLRNTTNASKFDNRVHETGTDSNVGETVTSVGFQVARLSDGHRLVTRVVHRIDQWCHDNRHLPIVEQQHKLNQKLRGHYAYYGVTGNSDAMNRFRQEVENRWRKWLNRRNNIRSMHWQKFCALLRRYPLAPARATRSKLLSAAKP